MSLTLKKKISVNQKGLNTLEKTLSKDAFKYRYRNGYMVQVFFSNNFFILLRIEFLIQFIDLIERFKLFL